MLHNMWPLVIGQKPLKCQEKPSGVYKMQTSGAAGSPPRTPLGELTALPRLPSWWGGDWLPPPQEPYPRSRPFRPRASALWTSPLPAPNFQTHFEVKSYIRPCSQHFSFSSSSAMTRETARRDAILWGWVTLRLNFRLKGSVSRQLDGPSDRE